MTHFRIGGQEAEYLEVKILSRSHNARDYWDGNWLTVEINIAAGGFCGKFGAFLRADEIALFHQEMTRLYSFESKEAKFETMEGQLSIDIQGDQLGHFSAACEAMDDAGVGNRLCFTLSFDQSHIPEILKRLDSVVDEYSVVGNPND